MIHLISGDTADIVWRKAAKKMLSGKNSHVQGSRLGLTHELLHVHFEIRHPRKRWVHSRVPAMNPAFAIAEAIWILNGSRDAGFINHWNPLLPNFSGHTKQYYGAYGHRLQKNFGFAQLERAYLALKQNPDSRQVVIQIWDPYRDFPDENGKPRSEDIPCNLCSLLKVRGDLLEWLQIVRSNDLYRGTPYNIVQFTILQEVIAGWLGLNVGGYHQISDSLHVYENDLSNLKVKPCTTTVNYTDDLRLSYNDSRKICSELYNNLKLLSGQKLSRKAITKMTEAKCLPQSYFNLLAITIADSARRRGWYDEMNYAIRNCTNPDLLLAWQAWRTRWIHLEEKDAMD